jgi:multiple sugar transport system substrate-binding protein
MNDFERPIEPPTNDFERSLDRRTLLSRAGRAGLGISVAAAAPGMFATPAGAGRAIRRSSRATEITVGVQDFTHPMLTKLVADFTTKTGISVKFVGGPGAGGDQVAQLTPQFASGSTPFDVLDSSDEASVGFLRAGWLTPLEDVVAANFWKDFPPVMLDYVKTWSTLKGHVYRIPHSWDFGYYFVRQDVLAQLGAKTPASWEDMLSLGAKAQKKGMFVFGDGAAKPSYAFVLAAYLTGQAGGNIFKFDKGTRLAFQFAKELIDQKFFPAAAVSWTYDQSNGAYMSNKLLTMRQWSYFYDVSRANKKWWSPKKTVIVLPPAGPARRATWAGAWGWTIPKFTGKLDEAKQFVRFITAPQRSATLATGLGGFFTMPRTSTLKAIGGKGLIASLEAHTRAGVIVPRPFHPRVNEAQAVVDTVFTGYLSGQFNLDEALKRGSRGIKALS